jgi:single-strand DNA-binding protein
MASVNKVILLGNLGADPELKYTPSNQAVCNLRIATNEVWKDKAGAKQERVEWHRVTCWGQTAENCGKYLAKGRSVYIEGKLQTRSWEDSKTGEKKYATEIVAERVQFIGGGEEKKSGGGWARKGEASDSGAAGAPDDGPPAPEDNSDIPF